MSDPLPGQRREHYRLVYPAAARPELRIDGRIAELHELAEAGIRIALLEGVGPGRRLVGLVAFPDGETVRIAGEVLRVEDDEMVLKLHRGFTLKRIIAEQQRMLREYPSHFDHLRAGEDSAGS